MQNIFVVVENRLQVILLSSTNLPRVLISLLFFSLPTILRLLLFEQHILRMFERAFYVMAKDALALP